MSQPLARSQCAIHADRPAMARCPSCQRFFCGECVTEHHGKLVCVACLAAHVEAELPAKRRFSIHPAAWIQYGLALAIAWGLFYLFARFLGDIPDAFHDGTIWE